MPSPQRPDASSSSSVKRKRPHKAEAGPSRGVPLSDEGDNQVRADT